jgi:hypothetical protein
MEELGHVRTNGVHEGRDVAPIAGSGGVRREIGDRPFYEGGGLL